VAKVANLENVTAFRNQSKRPSRQASPTAKSPGAEQRLEVPSAPALAAAPKAECKLPEIVHNEPFLTSTTGAAHPPSFVVLAASLESATTCPRLDQRVFAMTLGAERSLGTLCVRLEVAVPSGAGVGLPHNTAVKDANRAFANRTAQALLLDHKKNQRKGQPIMRPQKERRPSRNQQTPLQKVSPSQKEKPTLLQRMSPSRNKMPPLFQQTKSSWRSWPQR
jgi:hypothetical protein